MFFQNISGRNHRSFPDIVNVHHVTNQEKFKRKLNGYAKDLDAECYALNLPDQ